MLVEWPFTVSQARNQYLASLELLEEIAEGTTEEQLEPLTGPPGFSEAQVLSLYTEMTNLELQTTLLTIA